MSKDWELNRLFRDAGLISQLQAARELGISRDAMTRILRTGRLPLVTVQDEEGRKRRGIPRAAVARLQLYLVGEADSPFPHVTSS